MKKFFAYLLCVCILFSLSSCIGKSPTNKYSAYSFDYFDTVTSVTGYERSKEEFDKTADEILALLEEYHKLYTIYTSYDGVNNLCALNKLENGVHPKLTVDRRIVDMLLFAKDVYALTDGRTNIAMGSVLSVWHEYRTDGAAHPEDAKLPSHAELEAAALHTSIDDLIIDEDNCTVWLNDPGMTLDVGAVAKGYAVEMIARELEARGVSGYVLNVGGNVRTVGRRGDGEKWSVGVEDPDGDGYRSILALEGEALVTSGTYQRFYVVNGKNYHHIIDPATLMPAEGYVSISIVCKNSALADGLSTALFSMTVSRGLELIESLDGVDAMWVPTEGEIVYSSGFGGYTK